MECAGCRRWSRPQGRMPPPRILENLGNLQAWRSQVACSDGKTGGFLNFRVEGTVLPCIILNWRLSLCVVEAGSFNKAAEKLYISPPAVIKQINLLEDSLALQLFVRTHRGASSDRSGKSLYQDAKYIIQYCKDSVTRAKMPCRKAKNVIRIGTSPMTPAQVLVRSVAKASGGLPQYQVPTHSF